MKRIAPSPNNIVPGIATASDANTRTSSTPMHAAIAPDQAGLSRKAARRAYAGLPRSQIPVSSMRIVVPASLPDSQAAKAQWRKRLLQAWIQEGPAEESSARKRAVEVINQACHEDCIFDDRKDLFLSGFGLTSLPRCLHELEWLEDLDVSNNPLTALPSLPESLKTLEASDCQIATLPELPAGLHVLNLSSNRIAHLAQFPAAIRTVDLSSNRLRVLPQFPETLQHLNVGLNQLLRTLPPLPQGLKILQVACARLSELPVLPQTVQYVSAYGNNLRQLPQLPEGLETLDVCNNHLEQLPALPSTLRELDVGENDLKALPSLPAHLEKLNIELNHLGVLPSLPGTLKILQADDNILGALPALPLGLELLEAAGNYLDALPVLPQSLLELQISCNLVRHLPELPPSLVVLDVSSNALDELPALPEGLQILYVWNTGLSTLPWLPRSLVETEVAPHLLETEINRRFQQIPVLMQAIENLQLMPVALPSASDLSSLPLDMIHEIVTKLSPGSADAHNWHATNRFFKVQLHDRASLDAQLSDVQAQLARLIRFRD